MYSVKQATKKEYISKNFKLCDLQTNIKMPNIVIAEITTINGLFIAINLNADSIEVYIVDSIKICTNLYFLGLLKPEKANKAFIKYLNVSIAVRNKKDHYLISSEYLKNIIK